MYHIFAQNDSRRYVCCLRTLNWWSVPQFSLLCTRNIAQSRSTISISVRSLQTSLSFQAVLMSVVGLLRQSLFSRVWRYIWASALFSALLASTLMQWNSHYLLDGLYGVPVQCILGDPLQGRSYTGRSLAYLVVNWVVLVWSFYFVTVLLFPDVTGLWPFVHLEGLIYRLYSQPARILIDAQITRSSEWKKSNSRVAIYIVVLFVGQIISSGIFHILRVYLMLAYSAYVIFDTREYAAFEGRQGDENEWGFGQILPLLLLALPLSQLAEELLVRLI